VFWGKEFWREKKKKKTSGNWNGKNKKKKKKAGRILHDGSYTKGRRCISINSKKMSPASHRVAKKCCFLSLLSTRILSRCVKPSRYCVTEYWMGRVAFPYQWRGLYEVPFPHSSPSSAFKTCCKNFTWIHIFREQCSDANWKRVKVARKIQLIISYIYRALRLRLISEQIV